MAYLVNSPLTSHVILSGPQLSFRLLKARHPKAIFVLPYTSDTDMAGLVIYHWKNERRDVVFSGLLHLTMIVNDLQVAWKYGAVFLNINSQEEFQKADLCNPPKK
jgi:hypothetical protein